MVADFLTRDSKKIRKDQIIAAVRSEEQAAALKKLGINVLQVDLTDEKAVIESILRYNSMNLLFIGLLAAKLADYNTFQSA